MKFQLFSIRSRPLVLVFTTILLVSSIMSPLLLLVQPVNADPWDSGWLYRKAVTIDNTLVDTTLGTFPVLIDIVDDDLAAKAQVNGDDIVFTDSEGVQLSHEIEFYETGHLVAWVKVPTLSSTEDTVLYMYYGNPAADNQEDPEAVWDSSFKMVQHLEETSGTHVDSTVNGNDGAPVNGVVQDTTGKINGADIFDGTDDYVSVPHSSTLTGYTEALTAEAWIKLDDATSRQTILCKYTTSGSQRGWFLDFEGSRGLGFFVSQTGASYSYYYANSFVPIVDVWYHVVAVWESGQPVSFYVDGALIPTSTSTGTVPSIFDNVGAPLDIGRSTYSADRYFDGVIDEVRISNPARSAEWISTSYNNQIDPSTFVVVGIEEEVPDIPPTVVSVIPVADAIDVALTALIEVTFSEPMDTTATEAAFSLANGGVVSGSFVWSVGDTVLTFTPDSQLSSGTVYTGTISVAAEDQEGQTMVDPYIWSFTTAIGTPPMVIGHLPDVDEINVYVITPIEITFNKAMDQTATEAAFSLDSVVGTFSWNPESTVMTFTPDSNLDYETPYTPSLTTAAMDQQGDYLAALFEWTFTTAVYTPPIVVELVPIEDETGVFVITTVEVTFSESMNTAVTEAAFSLDNSGVVSGSFSWGGSWRDPNTILIFTPDTHLDYTTLYTATLTTAAMDEIGNSLEDPYVWSFTTASPTPPTVISHLPDVGETDVFTLMVEVTFSEAMDEVATEAAFSIDGFTGTFSWNPASTVMTFTLDSGFAPETGYTATITTAAMDQQGDYMSAPYIWSFTTAANQAPIIDTYTPVNLTPAVDEGDGLLFTHTSSDPEGHTLTYSWLLSYGTYDPVEVANTQDWTFLAAYGDADLYLTRTVTLVVSDGWFSNTQSWTVTINDMADPEITQKWVYNTGSGAGSGESSPVIADLLPGVPGEEVLYVGVDTVRCINGITGEEEWRYSNGAIGWNVQPQMEDINNDGAYEIVIPLMYPTGILVLNGDGTLYWQRNGIGGSSITSKPLLVDPDGDGYFMIFACPEDVRGYSDVDNPENDPAVPDNMWGGYTGRIWAFNYDGREINDGLWGSAGGVRDISGEYWDTDGDLDELYYQWFGWRPCSGGFSMADTDNDGLFELYQNDRDMYYSDGSHAKGTIAWEWSNELQQLSLKWYQPDMLVSSHAPMIVDVDKDGVLDIVAAHMRGGIAVFNSTSGAEIRKDMNLGLPGHYQPVVYDIDRDGNIEIILADGDHGATDIVIFDLVEWKEDARMSIGMCKFPPTVADVTGDGIMDMIAVSDTGVFAFDGSHNPAVDGTYPVIPIDSGLPYQCIYPVAQDIDDDGLTEFVFTSSGYRVYAYDTPAPAPALRPRSEVQFYNERRTGVAEYVAPVFYDRTVPIVSDPSPGRYATDVSVGITQLSFNIEDIQGDLMDYTVTTTIPVNPGDISGVGVDAGTITVEVTGTLAYNTKYTWTVSVTDGENTNNKEYILITQAGTPPGSQPTQDDPILASTGTGADEDATYEDMICTSQTLADPDLDDVTAIHRWLIDGSPMANLIMPFDTSSPATANDYSGFDNNAEIYGATWISDGKVGGAYSFDGVDDHMIIRDGGAGYYNGVIYPSDLGGEGDWYELTVEMWFNLNELSPKESTRLLMKLPSYEIGFGSIGGSTRPNNILSGGVWVQNPESGDGAVGGDGKATEYRNVNYNVPIEIETWYHVALTYKDGGELILYVNGEAVDTDNRLRGPVKASSGEPLYIGWFDYFNGLIDEVKIYSRCLSGEQISLNYNDAKDGVTGISTISWTETLVDEIWTCESTPNDGDQDGITDVSNPVTILPGTQVPPVGSNALIIGSDSESTSLAWANEDLVAVYDYFDANDDPEVFSGPFSTTIEWYMDGEKQLDLNNEPIVPASRTVAHTEWYYRVQVGDGSDLAIGDPVYSNIIIVNTPPIIESYDPEYTLGQSSVLLYVGESETFSFTYSEMDGDPVVIEWRDDEIRVYDVLSYTFTATETGSFRVEVRITDEGLGSTMVRQRWDITVR